MIIGLASLCITTDTAPTGNVTISASRSASRCGVLVWTDYKYGPNGGVQDMKDYGYAWAGVLPAGQEAAEKAMEKGCEVYRLYSDNTEGLCVDAKEIADHAAKGGMLGISKESWMAALEKENYLKAAEMSMEDDYGMIDGIINNGPKEDKTAEVKAPERGEKSSIMDRLKSAKAEKQKECCPPQKHKGEIEL